MEPFLARISTYDSSYTVISHHSQTTISRVACIAFLFLLLLAAIPVRATNNALPTGTTLDISFSPTNIPLGYYSTLTISASVDHDLYLLVQINLEGWLRWRTSDIRMGDWLNGGVVFRSDNQNLGFNYLQLALVIPKDASRTIQVPIYPTRAGIFFLNEVRVVTLPLERGNYVLDASGDILGLTISTLQFSSTLMVYDPTLKRIADGQQQILDRQNQTLGLLQNDISSAFSALASGLQAGFGGVSNQTAILASQQKAELQLIEAQYHHTMEAFYILLGVSVLILLYLFWFTYRLSKRAQ